MDPKKERLLRKQIIDTGKNLYKMRLVTGSSGNLSARLDRDKILITASGTTLGGLTEDEIISVSLNDNEAKAKGVTTEFPLHQLIFKNPSNKVVIHCHPALINGYFAVYSEIKVLTFESKLFLGRIPVVEQDTPAVTKPELVTEALKVNSLVVLRHHGVVAVGDKFKDALSLVEALEEAVKTAALARIFKKDILDPLDKELKESLTGEKAYEMFSKEHIQAIVGLINQDEFIAKKGKELNLTVELAIKLEGDRRAYKFTFKEGKVTKLELSSKAPFVISAPDDVWRLVFLGKLDSFVAVTQGKMKLEGQLGQLSRWYVPFSRLFELFREVKIR